MEWGQEQEEAEDTAILQVIIRNLKCLMEIIRMFLIEQKVIRGVVAGDVLLEVEEVEEEGTFRELETWVLEEEDGNLFKVR
jgi:hypothetical protein